ncbi:unnamed protein product [Auanema sp. JU1783]|nr:unnamed protein product [Auanema sp. JU1783]
MISLRSKENEEFKLCRESLKLSITLDQMVENLRLTELDLQNTSIPLPALTSSTLKKVVDFMNNNSNATLVPEPTLYKRFALSEEEKEFLSFSEEELVDLLHAANYLEIPNLINIITQKIANLIEGKSIDEIKDFFMIPNDLGKEVVKE